jgi:hypothetical protein
MDATRAVTGYGWREAVQQSSLTLCGKVATRITSEMKENLTGIRRA